MGCDIHSEGERFVGGKWEHVSPKREPFDWRDYGLYAFLAGVRNYSAIAPIMKPRGFPPDASRHALDHYGEWEGDAHTPSWLTLKELLEYDYEQEIEDRRHTVQVGPNSFDGSATCQPGKGIKQPLREFLGPAFFKELERLQGAGVERIVFWFDN